MKLWRHYMYQTGGEEVEKVLDVLRCKCNYFEPNPEVEIYGDIDGACELVHYGARDTLFVRDIDGNEYTSEEEIEKYEASLYPEEKWAQELACQYPDEEWAKKILEKAKKD